ncbi:unnamed protein product [Parnassius mnemosyne]|uniref:Fibroblast growth factor 10 n=1 Tax=Parnassius mnemosyne TaxID=213953 RepID=A0AAV1LFJ6_9NEOP
MFSFIQSVETFLSLFHFIYFVFSKVFCEESFMTAPARLPWARRVMRSRTRPLRLLLAALALASCAAAPAPEPRAQRSANLSHITGTSRTIQMFLKNRYLQLLPDGTVNGTTDGNSVYSKS